MAMSKAALIRATLEEVLRLGTGEPVSTEDSAAVEGRIAPVLASLSVGRIVTIENADAIPDWAFADLVRLLAEEVGPMFGRQSSAEAAALARNNLRFLDRRDRTSASPLVRAILDQLEQYSPGSAAVDATLIAEILPSTLAELARRDVIYLADVAEVEDEGGHPARDALTKYVAASLAQPQLLDVMTLMERKMRSLNARRATNWPLKIDFF